MKRNYLLFILAFICILLSCKKEKNRFVPSPYVGYWAYMTIRDYDVGPTDTIYSTGHIRQEEMVIFIEPILGNDGGIVHGSVDSDGIITANIYGISHFPDNDHLIMGNPATNTPHVNVTVYGTRQ